MLPEGWSRTTVGDACAIKNNLRFPLNVDQRGAVKGPYPYFGPTGILDHIDHYRIDEEFAVIGEDGDHFLKYRERPMTLHFSGRANVNNHAHVIGASEQCSPKWFYYWFMHRDLTPALSRQGVGRYKLTKKALSDLEIWLPSLKEQQSIAAVLSTWDRAIAATEKLLAEGRLQKQALSQSILSDSHRVRGSLLPLARRIAAELFAPVSIRGNANLPLLSVMQDIGVVPRDTLDRKVVMPEGSTEAYKRVEPGNFVISLRSFEGGLEYSRHRGLVSPAYTVIESRGPVCDDFYRHYFKSSDFIGRLAVAVIGIRDGKQISYDDFAFLRLPAPSLNEQHAIAKVLNAADALIDSHQQQLERLRLEKRALMADLLTGKRRIRLPATETTS